MAIDQVHDLQFAFREILDAMSRPGKLTSLQTLDGKIDYHLPSFDATLLTIMTLLDAEVTFHVVSENKHVKGTIAGYTLATPTTIEDADFVIVLDGTSEAEMIAAMENCKKGTLLDPHTSATWIIETAFNKENQQEIILTGPGIKEKNTMQTTLTNTVWQARNHTIIEYPLGIDVILTDDNLHITCMPRTTKVEMLEVK